MTTATPEPFPTAAVPSPAMDLRFASVLTVSALSALLSVGVVTKADRGAAAARTRRRAAAGRLGPDALHGHWVWAGVERDGRAELTVTDADMARHIGPGGWPGCPERVVCTRHGIRVLSVGAGGSAWWITNVTTSSDFEAVGRVRWISPGLAVFEVEHRFSCAHPDENVRVAERRAFRFWREGDRLRVGIDDPQSTLPLPSVAVARQPERWMVFRRVSAEALRRRHVLRLCQPTRTAGCDSRCFDRVAREL